MEAAARFVLTDPPGTVTQGECKVSVEEEALVVRPGQGGARSISLRDLTGIEATGFKVLLTKFDGSKLELSMLGHRYEDTVREVHRVRNELIMKDLLMGEKLRKQGVKGELRGPFRGAEGPVEIRLYDTALVLMPVRGPLTRVRYGDIRGIEARDYVLRIEMESGEQLGVGMLGRELDPLWKGISEAMAELEANVQALIKGLYPSAPGQTLMAASRLLKEGRAARRFDLEGLDPQLFAALEARLRFAGMGGEYDHLTSLGKGDMVRIGIKRSLVASEEDYVWFMVPLLGNEGNAVAMEATTGPSGGRATYFFRVSSRDRYPSLDDGARREEAEAAMDAITAGLQEINFRRQPIYLKDEDLIAPQWARYRFSVVLLPSLRDLRDRFIGRVSHTSQEEWTAKVNELLAFNASAKGSARWTSAQDEAEED
ncbi:MAG: hypothetical protein SA339_07880 [Methanomassiliicoccus sp.]|nr:hypothetical protein [Methanomassiliicoccus sp.]